MCCFSWGDWNNCTIHVYKYCIAFIYISACRNKKLCQNKCPNCQEVIDDKHQEYYCIDDVVIQRNDKTVITKKLFKPDLQKIIDIPPLKTLQPDPKLRDHITAKLPVNAHGIFANGGLTFVSAKRSSEQIEQKKWKDVRTCSVYIMHDVNFYAPITP